MNKDKNEEKVVELAGCMKDMNKTIQFLLKKVEEIDNRNQVVLMTLGSHQELFSKISEILNKKELLADGELDEIRTELDEKLGFGV